MKKFIFALLSLALPLCAVNPTDFLFPGFFLQNPVSYQFGMDDFGNVTLVWLVNNSTPTTPGTAVLQWAYKPAGGDWQYSTTTPQNQQSNILSTIGFNVTSFKLAVDSTGNAFLVWRVTVPSTNPRIETNPGILQTAYRPAGSTTWLDSGNPRFDFLVNDSANLPNVAIQDGNVGLVWVNNPNLLKTPSTVSSLNNILMAQAAYKPATAFTATTGVNQNWSITQVSPANFTVLFVDPLQFSAVQNSWQNSSVLNAFIVGSPQIAFDKKGNGVIAWQATFNLVNPNSINSRNSSLALKNPTVIQAVYKPAVSLVWPSFNTSFFAQLSSSNEIANFPLVAIQNGFATVIWATEGGAALESASYIPLLGWRVPPL